MQLFSEKTSPDHRVSCLRTSRDHRVSSLRTSRDHRVSCLRTSRDHRVSSLRTSRDHRVSCLRMSRDHRVSSLSMSRDHRVSSLRTSRDHRVSSLRTSRDHRVSSLRASPDHRVSVKEKTRESVDSLFRINERAARVDSAITNQHLSSDFYDLNHFAHVDCFQMEIEFQTSIFTHALVVLIIAVYKQKPIAHVFTYSC